MLEMKDSERLMRKVDKKMPIFNCTSKLRRLAWLLITLLMCQSGFSFAAQCDEYSKTFLSKNELTRQSGYRSKPSYKVITLTRLGQKLVRTKGRLRQIASKSFELYCYESLKV